MDPQTILVFLHCFSICIASLFALLNDNEDLKKSITHSLTDNLKPRGAGQLPFDVFMLMCVILAWFVSPNPPSKQNCLEARLSCHSPETSFKSQSSKNLTHGSQV